MKSNPLKGFASRNKPDYKPFKFDVKITVFSMIIIIFILDVFGLYPKAEFNYLTNLILYVLFFAAVYLIEMKKDDLG